jgi:hypothetical protein
LRFASKVKSAGLILSLALRAGALGIGAMASGAIFHVFRPAFVSVLRQCTPDRSHQKGCGAQSY